jgi:hypothetical protein
LIYYYSLWHIRPNIDIFLVIVQITDAKDAKKNTTAGSGLQPESKRCGSISMIEPTKNS